MISPYILRHASAQASVDRIQYFLRDYFHICQRQLPAAQRSVLMDCDLIWDFEENTCFPVFIRRGTGFCDVVTDPLAPPPKRSQFKEATFLTSFDDRRLLLRAERHLEARYAHDTDTNLLSRKILRSVDEWYKLIDLTANQDCAAIQVEKDGLRGIMNPQGKMLVPMRYKTIVPFSLQSREISLFICHKSEKFTNAVDVYDANGTQIYENIGGLFAYKEHVSHTIDAQGNDVPFGRFVDEVRVVMYHEQTSQTERPPYRGYIRKVDNMRLLPCADEDDGPQRIGRYSGEIRYARNCETLDLRDVHDVLYPIAEKMGAYYGDSAPEIMLSIPQWNVYRLGHSRLEWAIPDLPVHLMLDMPIACQQAFQQLGLDTAQKIADADLSNLHIEDESLECQIFLWQMQMRYTFTHPAEQDDEGAN